MHIVGRKKIEDFKHKHADAHISIDVLLGFMDYADWSCPNDIKRRYPKASILGNNQVIFNLRGSRYRLWVKVNYKNKIVMIKNVGNHDEYMKWKII
jgi:mRNA interferase HigB